MLNVGSLFSGIGGFDLGLERAGGFRTAWFCEQDGFCQHVLARHWPDVLCYPDITALRGADVEPVDVLCGGFPCQDLSYAGNGAGLAGARSGLWSEYARLVGELRPRYVVVENVSALLARGLGVVLGDLAALGYDAEWDCIPASAVGAPHQRDRIWLVAYPGGEQHEGAGAAQRRTPAEGLPQAHLADAGCQRVESERGHRELAGTPGAGESEGPERQRLWDAAGNSRAAVAAAEGNGRRQGRPGRSAGDGEDRQDLSPQGMGDAYGSPKDAHAAPGRSRRAASEPGWWSVEPDVGRVADGVPARVDRLRALGNALVPQIAEWIGHRIVEWERGRMTVPAMSPTERGDTTA